MKISASNQAEKKNPAPQNLFSFFSSRSTLPALCLMALMRPLTSHAFIPVTPNNICARINVARCFGSLSDQVTPTRNFCLPKYPTKPIKTVMAPMVAASDFAFRCLCRQYGAELTFTQMLHSKNLLKEGVFSSNHLDLYENTDRLFDRTNLNSNPVLGGEELCTLPVHLERNTKGPLIVQLAGNEVNSVVRAAKYLFEQSDGSLDGVDLNCGCPQGIARKGRYGAFLMEEDSGLVCDILAALRQELPESVSVSAKVRLPETDELLLNRIQALVDTDIDFLSIHGRTLKENKTRVREVHIERVRLAIEEAHRHRPDLPVVANGGVEFKRDVDDILLRTGASAVMSSEGLLEFPNIFRIDVNELAPREVLLQQVQISRDYLIYCRSFPPLTGVLGGEGSATVIKGHLFKILHRYLNENHDLRNDLTSIRTIAEAELLLRNLEKRYITMPDEDLNSMPSSDPTSSWYRRHRNGMLVANNRLHTFSNDDLASGPMTVEQRKALIRSRLGKSTKPQGLRSL